MLLTTRCTTPDDMKKDFESEGIEVIDNVGFDRAILKDILRKISSYAKPAKDVIMLKRAGEAHQDEVEHSREKPGKADMGSHYIALAQRIKD